MPVPNQIEECASNVLINIFLLDPEDEEESIFIIILRDTMSEDITDSTALLSCEDIHNSGVNLPFYLVTEVK